MKKSLFALILTAVALYTLAAQPKPVSNRQTTALTRTPKDSSGLRDTLSKAQPQVSKEFLDAFEELNAMLQGDSLQQDLKRFNLA